MTAPKTGCTGKWSFATFGQAGHSAEKLNRRDHNTHVEPYHCRHCNKFHVGENRSHGLKDARKEERDAKRAAQERDAMKNWVADEVRDLGLKMADASVRLLDQAEATGAGDAAQSAAAELLGRLRARTDTQDSAPCDTQ